MNQLTRIVLVLLLLNTPAMADRLEIKVKQKPLSLPYWPAEAKPHGAVLLVRGGKHPEWSLMLSHIAQQLAHYGWSVVLLNCEQTNATPLAEQLPEAIRVLRQQKNTRIVLVHYGEELSQSLNYFTKPQAKMINGLVLLSAYDDKPATTQLPNLRFPLFDIAGQFDYDFIVSQMNARSQELKKNYLSIEIPGARHDYEYSQKLLLAFIHGWMAKLPASIPQSRPVLHSYLTPIEFMPSSIASVAEYFITDLELTSLHL